MKINNDIFKKYLTDDTNTSNSTIALSALGGRRLFRYKATTAQVYPINKSQVTITVNSITTDKACIFFIGADNTTNEPTIGAIKYMKNSSNGGLKVVCGNTNLTLTYNTDNKKIMYINIPKYSDYTFIWNQVELDISIS